MATAKRKKLVIPKSLAAVADLAYTLREQRLALQRDVDAIEADEKALKEHIINNLPKSQASGITGRLAHAAITKRPVPKVENWTKLYAHIRKTGEFDLLGRSLAKAAVEERFAAKRKVPGVGVFDAITVSLTKK